MDYLGNGPSRQIKTSLNDAKDSHNEYTIESVKTGLNLYCHNSKPGYSNGNVLKENSYTKDIATQLQPQEFSLEDVKQLQQLNRELHLENIQKTVSYNQMVELNYQLQEKVSTLKLEDANRRSESNELLQYALHEIGMHRKNAESSGSSKENDPSLIKELEKYKKELDQAKREQSILGQKADLYKKQLESSNELLKNNQGLLNELFRENKVLKLKNQALEAELVTQSQHFKDNVNQKAYLYFSQMSAPDSLSAIQGRPQKRAKN